MSEHACKVKEAFYDKQRAGGRGVKYGQLLLSTVDSALSFMELHINIYIFIMCMHGG